MDLNLRLLLENGIFLAISTTFLVATGWAWREVKPFSIPQPLPGWFSYWFGSVQFLGIVPPLGVLVWGVRAGDRAVLVVLVAYFALLGSQILAEVVTLKRFESVVWAMVPPLYLPYRLWQLAEGTMLCTDAPSWVRFVFVGTFAVWTVSFLLAIAQLPRLFRWSGTPASS